MAGDSIYPNLEHTLSAERFSTYLTWADGRRDAAIELYTLNAQTLGSPLYLAPNARGGAAKRHPQHHGRSQGCREDGKGLRRKDVAAPLAPIRMLRNRVAHHEPILHWDLRKHYEFILQLTTWLSPVAADGAGIMHVSSGFILKAASSFRVPLSRRR
ncbi:MAG: hypothetical protein ACTHJ3_15525 [Pararhizobium sp.]